ncbi:MAG: histidine--tRNA ligase [Patescibacteria group bacterium]|nr:histidine--tRNA ligase [Patescibacteria group bacterium]
MALKKIVSKKTSAVSPKNKFFKKEKNRPKGRPAKNLNKNTSIKLTKKNHSSKKKHNDKIENLRGMRDILPPEQKYFDYFNSMASRLAQIYGYEKINLPLLEETDLFKRSIGDDTDIVNKEMFTFEDQGGESITLRPEGTASVCRSYIQHGMLNLPQPVKLFYSGTMYRHERPQKGRYREFQQFGLESLGSKDSILDAEMILIAFKLYKSLGIDVTIQINSLGCQECRPLYQEELVKYLKARKGLLCEECQKRLDKNPLRILDCKEETCQRIILEAPQIVDYLCQECKEHFISVLEYLDEAEVLYNLNPRIARGLDYYTKTIFEIWPKTDEILAQSALGGGGRYDKLIQNLGGQNVSACGMAIGIDRTIIELRKVKNLSINRKCRVFLIHVGQTAKRKILKLFETLRLEGLDVGQAFSKDSLRDQLEIANKHSVDYTLILGQKELLDNTILIRDMQSGVQEIIDIDRVAEEVKKRLKRKKVISYSGWTREKDKSSLKIKTKLTVKNKKTSNKIKKIKPVAKKNLSTKPQPKNNNKFKTKIKTKVKKFIHKKK